MQKELNIKKIQSKFQELIQLDDTRGPEEANVAKDRSFTNSILSANSASSQPRKQEAKQEKKMVNEELVFTKSDICRQVAKLKPYLRNFQETVTTVEQQDRANKRISDEQQNSLSELVLYLNKQLCEKLKTIEAEEQLAMRRQNRENQGWVYEVFYRYTSTEDAHELPNTVFRNGYVVLTEVLELFANLTFEESLLRININQVKRVKYMQEGEYQVIDIRFQDIALHVAFLNETQMKLFDRMLFLLKNMARTSSTRLFQNQLLKNIYSEY